MRSHKPVRWVAQENDQSCAIASIAMAVDVPFMIALKAVKGNNVRVVSGSGDQKRFNVNTKSDELEMIKGIRKLGFSAEPTNGDGVKFSTERLILSFGWSWAPSIVHCVVWCPVKRYLLDPCDKRSDDPSSFRFKSDQNELISSWRSWGSHALIVKRS